MHRDLPSAAEAMVRVRKVVEPDLRAHERYREYVGQYVQTYESLKDASHRLVTSLG